MTTEKYTISGDELVAHVKKLIHEGNIRRVRVIQGGKVLLEVPLSIGAPAAAIGIIAAPVLAAIGALAALITECTIEVEKVDKP
jgi:CBS domain-containing protein